MSDTPKNHRQKDLLAYVQDLLEPAERRRAVTGQPGVTGEAAAPRGQSPGQSQQPVELRQFVRADGEMRQRARPVPVDERPPARAVRPAPR